MHAFYSNIRLWREGKEELEDEREREGRRERGRREEGGEREEEGEEWNERTYYDVRYAVSHTISH